jgi:hypothetical protein
MPWAKIAYESNHDLRALETIKTAADTLHSRYSKKLGCIRSWDTCVTKKYNFQNIETDYMVIIVSITLIRSLLETLTDLVLGQHDESRFAILCRIEEREH